MQLTWARRNVHLRHPFNIAREKRGGKVDKQVLLVQIRYHNHVGLGEAAPMVYYQQSLDSAEAALAKAAALLGSDPFALEAIFERLWAAIPDQPATISAIDSALYDLIGKMLNVPIWKLLGLDRSRTPITSFTIGIDDLDVVASKTREAAEYPILKIKVGTPNDAQLVEAVLSEARGKTLRVDANCGWRSDNVLERCKALLKLSPVDLIEQPTPAGDHDGLRAVRAAGMGPLVADESCVGPADVIKCIGFFDGINIKLSKCGGIRRALQMIHTARAANLKVMLGCMVETSVGIAAAAQLAPLADWIDLDGHLLLADDPFEGIGGSNGRLTLNDRPGLGVVER